MGRALVASGVEYRIVDWDDDTIDWLTFDAVVIRSTWNYHQKPVAFAAWIDRVSAVTQLHNPAAIVHWNLDKRYLAELRDADLPVIATVFIADEASLDTAEMSGDIMVKPTVSAGSNDTARFTGSSAAACAHARSILAAGKAVMVQPYLGAIDTFGETGLLYFNGEFSHAFRKEAIFAGGDSQHNGLYVEEEISGRQPANHERALGDQVMAYIVGRFGLTPLYARIDVVSTSAVTAEIMEIELIEPSLFLHTDFESSNRFVEVIASGVPDK